jgi:hypothetical protein
VPSGVTRVKYFATYSNFTRFLHHGGAGGGTDLAAQPQNPQPPLPGQPRSLPLPLSQIPTIQPSPAKDGPAKKIRRAIAKNLKTNLLPRTNGLQCCPVAPHSVSQQRVA